MPVPPATAGEVAVICVSEFTVNVAPVEVDGGAVITKLTESTELPAC
jgi:hypothetical protein